MPGCERLTHEPTRPLLLHYVGIEPGSQGAAPDSHGLEHRMRLLHAGLPVILLALNGCAGVILVDGSRNESRAAIASVLAELRPELDSSKAAVCVQKAMTMTETLKLGTADNHLTVSPENRSAITTYAARPAAVTCLAALASGAKP